MSPRFAITALAAALIACQPAPETAEQEATRIGEESATATTALRAEAQAFAAHFSAGHFDTVASYYTADAFVMAPNGPAAVGRAAILAMFEGMGQAGTFALTLQTDQVVANGPLAVERGRYTLTYTPSANAPAGMVAVADTGKLLVQWQRTDAGWRMASDIWNSDIPVPPPAPVTPARRR